jgi:biopolymer transport protein ExbD
VIEFGEHIPERKALDLTPMLDVVFLLIIFFMLTSAFAKPMLLLDLPEATSGEISHERQVLVSLNLDGAIFLNGVEVDVITLNRELKKAFAVSKERDFSLQADEGVEFGRVVKVMDMARLAGAKSIAVVTENKE